MWCVVCCVVCVRRDLQQERVVLAYGTESTHGCVRSPGGTGQDAPGGNSFVSEHVARHTLHSLADYVIRSPYLDGVRRRNVLQVTCDA
jgi:hypothetical protein